LFDSPKINLQSAFLSKHLEGDIRMPTEEHSYQDGEMISKEPISCNIKRMSLYLITYMSQGLKVKGYLAVPDSSSPLPPLIYCRGGIRRVGMVRKHRIIILAQRGYAVFAPFYRGNEGGEGREDFGGEDRYDLFHAVTLVQSLPEVIPGPVPLLGFSRGALMALLAGAFCPGAGPIVVWGGVSDLSDTYEERVDLRRMLKRVVGHPQKQADAYLQRSPVHWANLIKPPVLIIHGTMDIQVDVSQARKLAGALEEAGKDYAMELYVGRGHRFPKDVDALALDGIFAWIVKKRAEMLMQSR
jgi:dipeptidyl aminopeptidase/acylaminoacyl peptidase